MLSYFYTVCHRFLCYVVIDILLTNLGLPTLSAFWLNSANMRGKNWSQHRYDRNEAQREAKLYT